MTPLLRAAAAGLGAFALAELLLFALVRWLRGFPRTPLSHLWAVSCGLASAVFVFGGEATVALRITLSITGVLTAWVAFDLIDATVFERGFMRRDKQKLPALLSQVARVLFLLTVLLFVLHQNHVPLQTVLVSSTVLSAVLGLALQDVLRNVFAGMAMQIEGVPRQGEWLELDGKTARVEEMGWRTTRLRTNEGLEIIEPNGSIAQQRLVSLGTTMTPRAFTLAVGLPYGLPPARAREALLEAASSAEHVVRDPVPSVFVHAFGDSSIVYHVRVWTHLVNRHSVFLDGVYSRIWYELARRDIHVPFPIRDVLHRDATHLELDQRAARIEERRRLLASLALFDELAPELVERLAETAQDRLYEAGEHLVREGDPGDSLMVVVSGRVQVTRGGPAARLDRDRSAPLDLAELGPGDFFGEMSLLTGEPRRASVTAVEETSVVVLSKRDLQPILDVDPDAVSALAVALADRSLATHEAVEKRRSEKLEGRRLDSTEARLITRIREFFRLGV